MVIDIKAIDEFAINNEIGCDVSFDGIIPRKDWSYDCSRAKDVWKSVEAGGRQGLESKVCELIQHETEVSFMAGVRETFEYVLIEMETRGIDPVEVFGPLFAPCVPSDPDDYA